MSLIPKLQFPSRPSAGDTIVEVLIAITIAAFAIGISYATANRSLLQAVTAQERNNGLNYLENQITDLKLRFQKTVPGTFASQFAYPASHFCLDDSASDPTSSSWTPIANYSGLTSSSTLAAAQPPTVSSPYNSGCHKQNGGADYYTDITTQSSSAKPYPTIYDVCIRWYRLGGGQANQSCLYYRLGGSGAPQSPSGPVASCSQPNVVESASASGWAPPNVTVDGQVYLCNSTVTTCYVNWGTTSGFGSKTNCNSPYPGPLTGNANVTATLNPVSNDNPPGPKINRKYYFQLCAATNTSGGASCTDTSCFRVSIGGKGGGYVDCASG